MDVIVEGLIRFEVIRFVLAQRYQSENTIKVQSMCKDTVLEMNVAEKYITRRSPCLCLVSYPNSIKESSFSPGRMTQHLLQIGVEGLIL
ncbi:hypothetical protein Tco_0637179 [Tanacetum coccineum]